MYLSKIDKHARDASFAPAYQTQKAFSICPDFTYSLEAEKGVIQGVSPGALPISATFKFAARPVDLVCHSFVECGYDLVIENGALSYVEHRLKDDYSY